MSYSPEADPFAKYAESVIFDTYAVAATVANKKKFLTKFGRNRLVGTSRSEIANLPAGILAETMLTANSITSVVSSSGSDTGTIYYEGHTYSGGDLTFVAGTATLTGQTAVTLGTALARISRCYSTSAATFVGDVAFYEGGTITAGVPDTDSEVHLLVDAGEPQSQTSSTSMSSTDYWILTGMTCSVLQKTAATAEFRIERKDADSTIWRPITQTFAVSNSSGTFQEAFLPYKIVQANSDVRLTAIASGAGVDCAGGISGYLAD